MVERQQRAYRYLLYHAMLEIRPLAWRRLTRLLPLNRRAFQDTARRIRYAGELADCLHNLALFSALDFNRFEEDWFWRQVQGLADRYPDFEVSRYRRIFEQFLAE
jgi:hypothetical protein